MAETMIERVDQRLLECVAEGDRASHGFARSMARELLVARKDLPTWLVFQRVDRTCFVEKVAAVLHRDMPCNGERVIATAYHEMDAEYIAAMLNRVILSESLSAGDGT